MAYFPTAPDTPTDTHANTPPPQHEGYEKGLPCAGAHAHTIYGKKVAFAATLDYYDDPIDVYRIALAGHERLTANVAATWAGANVGLILWRPPTLHVATAPATLRAAQSATTGAATTLTFTAPGRGWYYLEVKDGAPGFGPYTLTFAKSPPKP